MGALPPAEQRRAEQILERHETAAALAAEPMCGVRSFLGWLEAQQLRRGLVTRNSRKSVELVLGRLGLSFDAVVTREDAPPKPAPDPIWLACRTMKIAPSDVLFVGDFEFDMLSGRRAGARTVLLRNATAPESKHADFSVGSLAELRERMAAELTGAVMLPSPGWASRAEVSPGSPRG